VVDEMWVHHLELSGKLGADTDTVPPSLVDLDFDMPLTSEQIRGARALLNWSVRELSEAAGISSSTIKRLEMNGSDTVRKESVEAARRALEDAGVQFSSPVESMVGLRQPAKVA
jgi:DNA-binding XRE family transcriptional regulator